MEAVNVINMEPKFKVEWDFLEWKDKKYGDVHSMTQLDWNLTLVTMINRISAQIHKENVCLGGGNLLIVHPKTFSILQKMDYFNVDECTIGRYNIKIDDKIHPDKIIVKCIHKLLEDMRNKTNNPNLCVAFREDEENRIGISIIEPSKIDDLKKDGFKIITDSMMCGEVLILNHHIVDPITGEILIDYHNEISEDIWIPSPIIETSTLNIESLMENSRVLVNNMNESTKKTFIVPVGKPKLWYQKLINFFKINT